MAKTISDEQMKLTMIINGDSAQKEILDLEKATIKLKHANSDLAYERKLIKKQLGEESAEYKKLTSEIKKNNLEIEQNETKIESLVSALKVTDRTMEQLVKQSVTLTRQLKIMDPNSADFKKYSNELSQVKTRMGELAGKATVAKSSVGSLADGFNRYQGMALATIASLTGVALSIQKIIDINGKLSDAQSDVMKTTGLTKIEVDELTKSFGLLQTRTSRINLLGIAEQGGRIGIAKEEIGDFVKTMNMAAVSLGDSFTGGAEEVAEKLGKIKFLFAETKNLDVADAYNSIGSAINDLGANGVASEANIANFTTRIGSLTDVLKPTIQETLALGTAFEESGIEAEVSARAYNIFMKQASTESAKFAKVMGTSQKAVEDMINANPLDFMMKFAEGMRGMDATKTAKTLDYLGVNADGANKVIGAMGNNMGRFRELIDLSNNSFATGTSLINEYNIKNNNLAATLEKISKTVSGWFSSETFVKWLEVAVSWFAEFIGATEESEKQVSGLQTTLAFSAKLLAVLVTSLISYSIAARIAAIDTKTFGVATAWANVQEKLSIMWTSLKIAALTIYTTVTRLLGIETKKATASLIAMNVATKATPWGAIIGLITAAVAAYFAFRDSVNKAVVAQDSFAKQQKNLADEVAKSTSQTKAHLTSLITVINDTNVSLGARKKAYEELVKIAPEFSGLIIKEGEQVKGLVEIYAEYIRALDSVAYAKAMAKLNENNIKKELDLQQELYKSEAKLAKARKENAAFIYVAPKQTFSTRDGDGTKYADESADKKSRLEEEQRLAEEDVKMKKNLLKNQQSIVKDTDKFRISSIKNLEESIAKDEKSLLKWEKNQIGYKTLAMKIAADKSKLNALLGGATSGTNTTSNYTVPDDDKKGGAKKDPNSTQEEINRLKLENQAKYNDLLLKQQRQLEDDRIATMQDGYEKELAIEGLRYNREIDDLNRQKVNAGELAKLDEDIAKAKESKDQTKYNALLAIRKGWEDKNIALNDQIDKIKEGKLAIHNLKVGTIEEKAAKAEIEQSKINFDQARILRETKFNQELVALGNNKVAIAKRKKKYEANELLEEEKFLNELIEKFNVIVGKGQLKNIDLSLLTPQQVAEFTEEANKIGLTLSELIAKKNELAGKGTGFDILQGQGTDIFGFSPEQWEGVFSNFDTMQEKIAGVSTILGGVQNAFSMYSSFVNANQQKELKDLDKKQTAEKAILQRRLDHKLISQKTYDAKIKKLEEEKNKAQAEADYKKAKNDRIGTLLGIASNTAIGVMKSVAASPLTLGMPWSAIIGGMGLLQAALVLKAPLPAKGYESGLYGDYVKREQDNKIFKAQYGGTTKSGVVTKPTYFLTGENGPEMIIDSQAFKKMSPGVRDSLLRELRGIKGFEQGKYNAETTRYEVPASSGGSNDNQLMQMMMTLIAENTAVLQDLRDKGVIGKFYKNDLQSAKNIQDGIKDYNELRNKSKK